MGFLGLSVVFAIAANIYCFNFPESSREGAKKAVSLDILRQKQKLIREEKEGGSGGDSTGGCCAVK